MRRLWERQDTMQEMNQRFYQRVLVKSIFKREIKFYLWNILFFCGAQKKRAY